MDKVAAGVLDGITRGEWPVGGRLPAEAELAERYGVSRPVIREAIRHLQAVGLLTVVHGRGTFVLEPNTRQLLPEQALTRLLASWQSARDVHDARRALELGLTELAVARANEGDVNELRAIAGRARAIVESGEAALRCPELLELGFEFHVRLAGAAHSPLLARLYELILEPLHRSVEIPHGRHGDPGADVGFHDTVVDAIERRDAPAALAAMRVHLDHTALLALSAEDGR